MEQGINLDQLVDYKAEYWGLLKKPKLSGNNLTSLCPFHDDRHNSFSVDLKTGMWHCHSEDTGGNFVSFWAQIHGVDTKTAYKQILEKYGVDTSGEAPKREKPGDYTLEQYAKDKHLPEEWLREECRLSTSHDRYYGADYLRIPYIGEDGKETVVRKRFAKKEFRWKRGAAGKIGFYGEWMLPRIRVAKYAVLCEGESDSQSLWFMGVSALGIAGASMFKPELAGKLDGIRLYIHQEKDQGGDTFLVKTMQGLKDCGFTGDVCRFSCGDLEGCKDPSDVFITYGKEDGAARIRGLLQSAEKLIMEPEEEGDYIPVAIPDAPVNLRQPLGWFYSDYGISKIDERSRQPKVVCRTPIILTRRIKHFGSGEEKIEVAFKRDGKWESGVFPRSVIFTSRGITALSDLGCTVTSENAKQVVSFLSALEAENIDLISKTDATSTLGWQPDHRFIPGKGDGIFLDIDPAQRGLASAYHQTGRLEDWLRTMAPHRNRAKFRFMLAAAFAAPLLRILKQRIFFVYNWGGSKSGKTAGLKAALSAWGDPDKLMLNFNATAVGLERTAGFFCDLPLGIDERQLAGRNQEGLEKVIYMIASGTGKTRGAKAGGTQKTQTWRTVAIATGEEPLSTETTQTGVSTRVLELYGGPFTDERSASKMHQEAADNCGWAGPAFVNMLIRCREDAVREWYDVFYEAISAAANGKSGSHISGVTAVALADAMLETWLYQTKHWPTDPEPESNDLVITDSAFDAAVQMAEAILKEQLSAEAGDVNENAVQFIADWVVSNRNSFGTNVSGPCFGTMSDDGNTAYIFPSILQQALTKAGYSSRKTLKYMADEGLITSSDRKDNGGKNYQVVKRIGSKQCKMVEFFIGKTLRDLSGGDEIVSREETEDAGGFVQAIDDLIPFNL